MPRPKTKDELEAAAAGQFDKLWALVDSMTDEERTATFLFEDRDKNVRDVLIHLYEWHRLLMGWLESNLAGDVRPFLPKPYNWKTYPQMNVAFWEKHQGTSLADAESMVKESHAASMALIEGLTDEELFEKKHFPWTGTTNVGSYCISATSSHYDWAMKKIKQHVKTYREATRA